ncbi:hypothetical protein HispidOSU_013643, partial [Sigmodon hispidus]
IQPQNTQRPLLPASHEDQGSDVFLGLHSPSFIFQGDLELTAVLQPYQWSCSKRTPVLSHCPRSPWATGGQKDDRE